MAKYTLTKEGESYLKKGLPEKKLVTLLESLPEKSIPISEAAARVENFPIALKWALEEGWVSKEKGNVVIKSAPKKKTGVEESLEKVSKGKEVSDDMIKILLERKLVDRITETYERTKEEIEKSGNEIGELTHDIIRTGLWKGKKFKPVKIDDIGKLKKSSKGNRQPYNNFLLEVRKKLVDMGFKEVRGRTIITEFWNFDALYQAQNHPSRDWTQTYSLKFPKHGSLPDKKIMERVKATHENGWKTGSTGWKYKWDENKASKLMPVAHDTAFSPIKLCSKNLNIPGKYFQIVRCYRPDVIDATHGVEFNQMGGIVVSEDLNFRNLLGMLKEFVQDFIGPYEVKFSTGYFPFTEPSCEIYIKHPQMGWIEAAGAGIFRPELTEPLGVKVPVMAWGAGIDRLAMFKLGVTDIRELFSKNLKWLRGM